MRSDTTILGCDQATQVAVKTCAPFVTCIIKINGTAIDDAEGLNLVMPICIICWNTVGIQNYSDTTGILWIYSKDEATDFNNINNGNDFKFFKYKAKLLGNTAANGANGILTNTATVYH